MALLRLKHPSMVGLSIHHGEVRLLKLRQKKQQIIMEDFAVGTLPPGVIENGKIMEMKEATHVLASLVSDTKSKHDYTAIAISGNQVISKQVRLASYLNKEEGLSEITSHIGEYLPGVQEDVFLDYLQDKESDHLTVIAAKAEQINSYAMMAYQAGLNIQEIDIDTYALMRALNFVKPTLHGHTAILDVDTTFSQFIVLRNHEIMFARFFLHEFITKSRFDSYCLQLKQAMLLAGSVCNLQNISQIFLSGKKDELTAIKQFIENEFSINVVYFSPFEQMIASHRINLDALNQHATSLVVACGLALRGCLYG